MPTTVDTEAEVYAHCAIPRCPGNRQEKVQGIRREVSETYREIGGDSPGVYRSWVSFHVDDETRPCPTCKKPREVTDQPRKQYPGASGHDPMGLLGVPEFNAAQQPALRESNLRTVEVEEFERQIAELREMVATLTAKPQGEDKAA